MPDGLTLTLILELILIGGVAGVLGGMLGIGGGVVMIPGMALLLGTAYAGPESFHLYKLAAITTTIALSVPAVTRHYRAKALRPRLLIGVVPFALVGVGVGVLVSSQFVAEQTRLLRQLFGGFLVLVAIFNVYRFVALRGNEPDDVNKDAGQSRLVLLGSVVGIPAGMLAGLLGVGGGVWAVPAQRLFLKIPTRNAIANSAATILPISIFATLLKAIAVETTTGLHPAQGFLLAVFLAPAALIGAWSGAGLTHKLPVYWLRLAFQVVLLVAGYRLIVQ